MEVRTPLFGPEADWIVNTDWIVNKQSGGNFVSVLLLSEAGFDLG
jgi:hypothetical protein